MMTIMMVLVVVATDATADGVGFVTDDDDGDNESCLLYFVIVVVDNGDDDDNYDYRVVFCCY